MTEHGAVGVNRTVGYHRLSMTQPGRGSAIPAYMVWFASLRAIMTDDRRLVVRIAGCLGVIAHVLDFSLKQ